MNANDHLDRRRLDVALLAVCLPGLLELVQDELDGDQDQAALSTIAARPPGGDTSLYQRYRQQIEWAVTVYGLEEVRNVACELRDLPAGSEKNSKIDELAAMLNLDEADALVNGILDKIQQGQTPSERELRILTAAKNLYRDSSE